LIKKDGTEQNLPHTLFRNIHIPPQFLKKLGRERTEQTFGWKSLSFWRSVCGRFCDGL